MADVLADLDVPCLVVERDLDSTEEAEAAGLEVLMGDAANSEILKHASLEHAKLLVITTSGESSAEKIAHDARAVNPNLTIIGRAETEDGVRDLAAAGVAEVVRPQLEGGNELMRHTLLDLGYRPRQIQGYVNDLRESGYEAMGEDARVKRSRAIERLVAGLADADIRWVRVEDAGEAFGRTLAEIDLRARTGASVVAFRHDGQVLPLVDPDAKLCPGDCLALMGVDEDVEAAEKLLAGE